MRPLVMVSGFGSFERFAHNPSEKIARRLAGAAPARVEVRAEILPVSFDRAPGVWDRFLASLGERRPAAVLGLGVQRKSGFRIECCARGRLSRDDRPDVDGRVAAESRYPGEGLLSTELDPDRLAGVLRAAGAERVSVSSDAGGFVCERAYFHLLSRCRELGVPAVFLHVPPEREVALDRQIAVVAALVAELANSRGP